MTKTASVVVLSVICVLALFFGVCSCLPAGLPLGTYDTYNAAVNLIQGDAMFTDSVSVTYKVKLNEDATLEEVVPALRARLADMYSRWFASVKTDANNNIIITVPKTVNEEKISETTILSNVTATGKVEVVKDSTYSETGIVLKSEHIASMKTQRYVNGSNSFYIVSMTLTKEGKELAKENLTQSTSSWSAWLAVDGASRYPITYNADETLHVYTNSDAECQYVIGLTNSGALGATLTQLETNDNSSVGGLVFGLVCVALMLGTWIFYIVKFRELAIAPILSQLVAAVVFVMFAGIAYFVYLNIASAIGIILSFGLMAYFTYVTLDKMSKRLDDGKDYASARTAGFDHYNKLNLIVHAIVLVVGIVLWLIPTGVTAPLGNALVYGAVLSFAVTMGLNRLFLSALWNSSAYGLQKRNAAAK